MKFTRLSRYEAGWFAPALRAIAKENGYSNVFNPSIAFLDGTWHLAFRAQARPGEKPFRSYYANGSAGKLSKPIDLTQILQDLGTPQVADPKLVPLAGRIYITFNTGHSAHSPNGLYLMQVWPEIGVPQKCELDGRQTVEKNWAFYMPPHGTLSAIYSLEPLTQLRLVQGQLDDGRSLHFERIMSAASNTISQSLSIGTQMAFVDSGTAYMVAHEKPRLRSKRGYLGRIVRLDFDSAGAAAITVGSKRLIHSFAKLILMGQRHNPNLLWAVYFPGIVVDGNDVLLSYGINDLEFAFAEIPLDTIWP